MSFFSKTGSTYIIAEISANHNGSLDAALNLVRVAKECGADAVKIQTYTADTLTLDCDNEYFRISGGTLWDGKTLHQLYQEAHTPWEWHDAIFAEARKISIDCFSTPFDETAVDFLEQFDPPCHKIASFELVHDPLIRKIAATGRPVILSTGMATLEEISHAVQTLKTGGCTEFALLKCTSSYPAPPSEANLARIPHMASAFGCVTGLSDHTMGIAVPVAAVALGAKIIEKHLCLSRGIPGPDSAFSLEPDEFRVMIESVRIAESAIGKVIYEPTAREKSGMAFRPSLFFVRDLPVGHAIQPEDVRIMRPGHGLPPRDIGFALGRCLERRATRGTPVTLDFLGLPHELA